jgi:hypothetical protein
MDVKRRVAVLHAYSEELRQLGTQLNDIGIMLGKLLSIHAEPPTPETEEGSESLSTRERQFLMEAQRFCQQTVRFFPHLGPQVKELLEPEYLHLS